MAIVLRNPRQPQRHRAQHPVAGIVAVGIVDALEIVDIADRHAQRGAGGMRLGPGFGIARLEGAAGLEPVWSYNFGFSSRA